MTDLRNTLCLDLGTCTGWALIDGEGKIFSGTETFARSGRFDGGGIRYLRFSRWLSEVFTANGGRFELVVYEEVRAHSVPGSRKTLIDAAHAYGSFLGILSAWCEEREIPYEGYSVGKIKKAVTGRGNASKQAVIASVRNLGHDPADHNEADALALLYTARSMWR